MTPAQAFGRTLLVALVLAVLGLALTGSQPAPVDLPADAPTPAPVIATVQPGPSTIIAFGRLP